METWELTPEEIAVAVEKGVDDYKVNGGLSPYVQEFVYRAIATAAQKKLVEWLQKLLEELAAKDLSDDPYGMGAGTYQKAIDDITDILQSKLGVK